jgi:hypothetical protein
MHWLINAEYPGAKAYAAKDMKRLAHLGKILTDARHYYWLGCGLDKELIIALDIMRRVSGDVKPMFYIRALPYRLIFSVVRNDTQLICGVFFSRTGEEWETSAAVEQLPPKHTAAIYLEHRGQIPLFSIKRPHIFVCQSADGSLEYIDGMKERGG